MEVDAMRIKVKSVYNNAYWASKVDRMADNQVIAIYYSMLEKGKFEQKKKKIEDDGQYTIFNYL